MSKFDIADYFTPENYFNPANVTIPKERIFDVDTSFLCDLYYSKGVDDGFGKSNIFFVLLNEYYYLKKNGGDKEISHVCNLISFYLFMLLTPPASCVIAKKFALEALEYENSDKNVEWLKCIEKGN